MSKKLIYLICLALVLSMASQASAELILHWRFDEGSDDVVNDSSGNGHVGTIEGATWTVDDKGPCLEFGGDGDRVVDESGADYLNGMEALTVAMWIKSNAIGTDAGFLQGEDPDGGDNVFTMRYDSSGASFSGSNVAKMAVTSDQGGEQQLESSSNIQVTEWQHVAMTWESGGLIRFYIDGVEDTPSGRNGPNNAGVQSDVMKLVIGQGAKDAGGGWDGLIDDVRIYNHVLSEVELLGAMEGTIWPYAIGPVPADGSYHEDTWVNLSWTAGGLAVSHDVYLGETFDAVNEGAEDTFQGNQVATFLVAGFPGFAYPDGLVPGTTYYWRIDEVNETEPNSPWKGDVWSFSIPPKTAYLPEPADAAEAVGINDTLTWTPGFGAKLHTVYFGDNFDEVSNAEGGLPQGAATFSPGPLEMAKTYYWRVDEFDAISTHKGDVWSFITEGAVGSPNPAKGAVDVTQTPVLTWVPGVFADTHEVYFGADAASLELKGSGNLGAESFEPGQLEWDTTYYWRIDEVNNANANSPWTGPLWSFTTANFLIIDDMESYNDLDPADPASNRIFNAWIDGFGDPTNGSLVGYANPPFAEQTIVHSGNQSMPLEYDNSAAGKSEATLTSTSNRDWTVNGVNRLTIWFRGDAGNTAETLYVALNDSARVDNDNPDAATITSWTEWNIDLQTFADQGVNLANVNSITLGLSSVTGGTGIMYFDDIRLLAP
ncbi:MAG: LamG domain-containing protein [Planctomycetes bacterium]|nr:LamG domain-containing protein [Planctomycetota bacterium]